MLVFFQEEVRMIVKTNMAAPDIVINNGTNIKVPIETPIKEIEQIIIYMMFCQSVAT